MDTDERTKQLEDSIKRLNENLISKLINESNNFPSSNLTHFLSDYLDKITHIKHEFPELEVSKISNELKEFNIHPGDKKSATRHIGWHEYFMSVALLAARRSKDPATQVGACIVNDQNKIIGTGYNGMPRGVNDTKTLWVKEGPYLETKYAYVVHAELNAILNCVLTDQTGCRIYVSLYPCNECAKAIVQSGIRHVIYLSDKHKDKDSTKAARKIFDMTGVICEQYSSRMEMK